MVIWLHSLYLELIEWIDVYITQVYLQQRIFSIHDMHMADFYKLALTKKTKKKLFFRSEITVVFWVLRVCLSQSAEKILQYSSRKVGLLSITFNMTPPCFYSKSNSRMIQEAKFGEKIKIVKVNIILEIFFYLLSYSSCQF